MAGATQLALLVGLISLALGILRFGFVVDFMSHSVMSSFCTASGVIIATSQLKHVLGISMKRHKHWWETAVDLILKLPEADGATAALGFTLLAFLTFMKAWTQQALAVALLSEEKGARALQDLEVVRGLVICPLRDLWMGVGSNLRRGGRYICEAHRRHRERRLHLCRTHLRSDHRRSDRPCCPSWGSWRRLLLEAKWPTRSDTATMPIRSS